MDRLLVALGSLLTAAAIAFGVLGASDRPAVAGPPASPSGPAAPSATGKGGLEWADLLAYEYQAGLAGLPDRIKALEGKKVTIRGYLLPLVEFDDIHEFFVVPNHMSCCFGMPAGVNGEMHVKLAANERGLPNTSEPLEATGTFHAVETKDQGVLLSIFRLDDATARIVGY